MSDFAKELEALKGFQSRADAALLKAGQSTTPSGNSGIKRVNLKCNVDVAFSADAKEIAKLGLPDVLETEYQRFASWAKWMFDGPIDKIRKNLSPWQAGEVPYSNFDFRWLVHWSFPHKFIGRIFRYKWTVERVAQVYVDLWETSEFSIIDKNLLERTLSPGLVMSDVFWFADNLDIPIVARAYKLCMAFLKLHKARVARDAKANYPSDPKFYRRMHPMYHPSAAWMMWLWGEWVFNGDKEALEGYKQLAADFRAGFDYATTAEGVEIVVVPHFVVDWFNRIRSEKISFPAGAQDATYCETFLELCISLFWAGADVIDERFLAAYANTMMLAIHSEGFGNGSEMAEAICGSTPKGQPAQNKKLSVFLIGGEVVKTRHTESNRTNTRQHSISSRRAAMHAAVPWATKKYPKKAKTYRANLDSIKKIDSRLGPPAVWKLGSLAHELKYRVTEAN